MAIRYIIVFGLCSFLLLVLFYYEFLGELQSWNFFSKFGSGHQERKRMNQKLQTTVGQIQTFWSHEIISPFFIKIENDFDKTVVYSLEIFSLRDSIGTNVCITYIEFSLPDITKRIIFLTNMINKKTTKSFSGINFDLLKALEIGRLFALKAMKLTMERRPATLVAVILVNNLLKTNIETIQAVAFTASTRKRKTII